MNDDCLKLTTYFGERDRAGGGYLADALSEIYARHQLGASLVMRGIEGFGAKQHLHTDRLLTLSEDLPLVSVAVDERPMIEAALAEMHELRFDGLVTLERARMLTEQVDAVRLPPELRGATKLTVYVGRHERTGSRPAYEAVVALLHRGGIGGAAVLLGVDGTAHGIRQRARFFARNAAVPLMVLAVGDGAAVARILPELGAMLARPLITLEPVRLCKRDGQHLAGPHRFPPPDALGMGVWQKLSVYTDEQARDDGHPLHRALVHRLRHAGAAGATSLRAIWGFNRDHEPHGDSFWQLRRRLPVLTVVLDRPERVGEWFAIVDELTHERGLVTSEMVPAFTSFARAALTS